jgi:hypothetical protein
MYVLRRATDPEVQIYLRFQKSMAETERLATAQTLQGENYSALELWQQEHCRDMTTAASYSKGLEEHLAAAASKYSALDLLQQEHHQDIKTSASYCRELEHQLAAATSRCNALEAAETSALQCAASPDLCHANTLYAAENLEKVDKAATTEPGTTSEDRKANVGAIQQNLAAVPSDLASGGALGLELAETALVTRAEPVVDLQQAIPVTIPAGKITIINVANLSTPPPQESFAGFDLPAVRSAVRVKDDCFWI